MHNYQNSVAIKLFLTNEITATKKMKANNKNKKTYNIQIEIKFRVNPKG